MNFQVQVLEDAEEDLFEIFNFVAVHDSLERAYHLLAKLEERCGSLGSFPHRGRIPPELKFLGVLEYREVLFKPYRIFFRVEKLNVFVYAVLDGRRELSELLQQRLLR
ncbi:MAG: type II toxin-antitoxin system RelE/ParE family toxin [Planctomycetes bacterium]|nr:type II toxin-antitoxin system RelE/ParE family toxin [Planctomycetota bacterium]